MNDLWFYDRMARFSWLTYRGKIMVMAFAGTHVPLISLAVYFSLQSGQNWATVLWTLGVTLVATLLGTGATMWVLSHLLRPVQLTSDSLRHYAMHRTLPQLPTHFSDTAGTLMADAQTTVTQLDGALQSLERFDPVTGLLNRTGFILQLRNLHLEGAGLLAVRIANGEKVKTALSSAILNDVHQSLVQRFHTAFRTDLKARVGDLDYVIVLPKTNDSFDVRAFHFREMLAALSDAVGDGPNRVIPELVAGFAHLEANISTSIDNALAATRMATLTSPIAIHSPQAQDKLRDDFLLERDLRSALKNDELALHFQPVMDVVGQAPIGAEALLRWHNPARGMVSPVRFIPVAERSGLIDPIGLWVLRNA